MYRVLLFIIFLSFQAFTQDQFDWVKVNSDSDTYYFPNVNEIFLNIDVGESISCDSSEYTVTSNVLSEEHYDKDRNGCHNFISPKGEYGTYAHRLINHIKTYPYTENEFLKTEFPGMSDGAMICPNWKKLDINQKFDFWIWTFASIAWDESRCLPNRVNSKASDGVAVGLFQLNKSKKQRYWRGGRKRSACAVDNVLDEGANIECSIEIMHEVLKGKRGEYKGSGALYGKEAHSYWQSLRSDKETKTTKLITGFEPCHKP